MKTIWRSQFKKLLCHFSRTLPPDRLGLFVLIQYSTSEQVRRTLFEKKVHAVVGKKIPIFSIIYGSGAFIVSTLRFFRWVMSPGSRDIFLSHGRANNSRETLNFCLVDFCDQRACNLNTLEVCFSKRNCELLYIVILLVSTLKRQVYREQFSGFTNFFDLVESSFELELDRGAIYRDFCFLTAQKEVFEAILSKVNVQRVCVIDRSDKMGVLQACNEFYTPIIEIGHGTPCPMKFNYDFPARVQQLLEIDLYISFFKTVDFEKFVLSFSKQFLEVVNPNIIHKNIPSGVNDVMIVGQSDFFDHFRDILVIVKQFPGRLFYFKPHPSDCSDYGKEIKDLNNVIILPRESSWFYENLPKVALVVGWYSTCLVEAQLSGWKVLCLPGGGEVEANLSKLFGIQSVSYAELSELLGSRA